MEKKKTMPQSSEEKRGVGRPRTGLTQKHISFRCDIENIEYLSSKPNKGGFLNKLIREAKEHEGWPQDCAEMPPESDDDEK